MNVKCYFTKSFDPRNFCCAAFLNSRLLEFSLQQSGSRSLKAPGARDSFRLFQRLLFGQPFFPILRELIHVILGDGNQFSLHERGRRIFVFRDLVVQHVD
jgi:hypothetical protein